MFTGSGILLGGSRPEASVLERDAADIFERGCHFQTSNGTTARSHIWRFPVRGLMRAEAVSLRGGPELQTPSSPENETPLASRHNSVCRIPSVIVY